MNPADASTDPPRRPVAAIAAELADVDRFLHESPPHSSGDHDRLALRRAALQRELAAARGGDR